MEKEFFFIPSGPKSMINRHLNFLLNFQVLNNCILGKMEKQVFVFVFFFFTAHGTAICPIVRRCAF